MVSSTPSRERRNVSTYQVKKGEKKGEVRAGMWKLH